MPAATEGHAHPAHASNTTSIVIVTMTMLLQCILSRMNATNTTTNDMI